MVTGYETRGTEKLVKKQIEANKKASESFVKEVARKSGRRVKATITYGGGTSGGSGSKVESYTVDPSGAESTHQTSTTSFVVGSPGEKAYQEKVQAVKFAKDRRASVIVRDEAGRVLAASQKVRQYQPGIMGSRLSQRQATLLGLGLSGRITKSQAKQLIEDQRNIKKTQLKYSKIIIEKVSKGQKVTRQEFVKAVFGRTNINLTGLSQRDSAQLRHSFSEINKAIDINKKAIALNELQRFNKELSILSKKIIGGGNLAAILNTPKGRTQFERKIASVNQALLQIPGIRQYLIKKTQRVEDLAKQIELTNKKLRTGSLVKDFERAERKKLSRSQAIAVFNAKLNATPTTKRNFLIKPFLRGALLKTKILNQLASYSEKAFASIFGNFGVNLLESVQILLDVPIKTLFVAAAGIEAAQRGSFRKFAAEVKRQDKIGRAVGRRAIIQAAKNPETYVAALVFRPSTIKQSKILGVGARQAEKLALIRKVTPIAKLPKTGSRGNPNTIFYNAKTGRVAVSDSTGKIYSAGKLSGLNKQLQSTIKSAGKKAPKVAKDLRSVYSKLNRVVERFKIKSEKISKLQLTKLDAAAKKLGFRSRREQDLFISLSEKAKTSRIARTRLNGLESKIATRLKIKKTNKVFDIIERELAKMPKRTPKQKIDSYQRLQRIVNNIRKREIAAANKVIKSRLKLDKDAKKLGFKDNAERVLAQELANKLGISKTARLRLAIIGRKISKRRSVAAKKQAVNIQKLLKQAEKIQVKLVGRKPPKFKAPSIKRKSTQPIIRKSFTNTEIKEAIKNLPKAKITATTRKVISSKSGLKTVLKQAAKKTTRVKRNVRLSLAGRNALSLSGANAASLIVTPAYRAFLSPVLTPYTTTGKLIRTISPIKPDQKIILKVNPIYDLKPIDITKVIQQITPVYSIAIAQVQSLTPAQAADVDIKQLQLPDQKLLQQIKNIIKRKAKKVAKKQPPTRVPVGLFIPKKFTWKSKIPKGYVRVVTVLVKQKGKIRRLRVKLTENRALTLAKKYVDNKTIRSFQLQLIGLTKGKDIKKPSLKKFRSKLSKNPKVLGVVEKTKYAIDSPGEKRELRLARKR